MLNSVGSQPQNTGFRNNPDTLKPCTLYKLFFNAMSGSITLNGFISELFYKGEL